eukprot:COSAG01_NODE_1932_length_8871_cov_9.527984_1_plen_108_part_00
MVGRYTVFAPPHGLPESYFFSFMRPSSSLAAQPHTSQQPQSTSTHNSVPTPLPLLKMAGNAERTYLMIKPDGVQRGLVGDIISRFEKRGYKLVLVRPRSFRSPSSAQ